MLIFDQVTKSFFDDSFAIKDVSFQIDPGELVLITGPSGSGKTTLMRLITKEYTPSSGEILFDNQPIQKIKNDKIHQHRRKIGVVFQDYRLVPEMNVWENIALALSILGKSETQIEERVTDLLTLIDMKDKAFLFPTQLSGGEAQRVSIARALAPAPALIFADEPTGNLDQKTANNITNLLKKINELGTTILLATHDISVLDLLDNQRTIQLEKGKLIKDTGDKKQKTPNLPSRTRDKSEEMIRDPKENRKNNNQDKITKPELPSLEKYSEQKPKKEKRKLSIPFFGKKKKSTKDEKAKTETKEDKNKPRT